MECVYCGKAGDIICLNCEEGDYMCHDCSKLYTKLCDYCNETIMCNWCYKNNPNCAICREIHEF